ncbi:MAG TPA: ABC transporter permease [Tepidisphaeraceae bacterium]|jgi:ABC-2 type transport system permease protein|nr:ABC transporter permease [Tepidisphaeraceae bacterium]
MNGLLQHLALSLRLNFRSKQAIIYGYVVPIFFLFALGSVFATKPPLLRDMGRLLTVTILGGACFGMPTAMVAERERGVWRRYRLLPAATGGIILSAMVARFVIILSAAVMQIALARLIYKTPFPQHPIDMLGAFVFVCFAFLGLGLVIAMVSDNVPAVQAMGQAIFLPLIIIGGVGVRLESLPAWAIHIAGFLPGIYAVNALQACQMGPGLIARRFDLLSLTIIGLAAIVAGAKLFRWDVGQKLTGPAKGWVAVAVVGWLLVGFGAEFANRVKAALTPGEPPAVVAKIPPATTHASPATTQSVAIAPPAEAKAPWEKLTQKEIDSITYDDLPDDGGTVTPLAADLNSLDDDGRKRMENFNDALSDWAPGQVENIPQRVRNLLSLCAVADIVEDQHEAQIPYVVFNYMRANIQKDQLTKAVAWVVLNPSEGTAPTNIKDMKELGIDGEVPEDTVRERATLYGKKLLFRLLKKG